MMGEADFFSTSPPSTTTCAPPTLCCGVARAELATPSPPRPGWHYFFLYGFFLAKPAREPTPCAQVAARAAAANWVVDRAATVRVVTAQAAAVVPLAAAPAAKGSSPELLADQAAAVAPPAAHTPPKTKSWRGRLECSFPENRRHAVHGLWCEFWLRVCVDF